jgi:hypothetical protein
VSGRRVWQAKPRSREGEKGAKLVRRRVVCEENNGIVERQKKTLISVLDGLNYPLHCFVRPHGAIKMLKED